YEIRRDDGRVLADGWSDWVYVDVVRGRPRSVSPEMKAGFRPGADDGRVERTPLEIDATSALPFRHRQVVVLRDLDGFAHMNNAATIDLLEETVVAALARGGYSLDRLIAERVIPRL